MHRVLIVEDDADINATLQEALRLAGYDAVGALTGEDAFAEVQRRCPDLVLLDQMLPDVDGIEVCRRLRVAPRTKRVPIIFLTARSDEQARVRGLDAGADDYLAKPFEIEELEARIRAQLRRASNRAEPVVACGDLVFDTNTRLFGLAGETLALTPREHAVLEQLVLKAGQTVSKAMLSAAIYDFEADADPSAIEIYVHRLRKKLEGGSVRIVTLRGLGYLLKAEE